jgi:hypothetical protein
VTQTFYLDRVQAHAESQRENESGVSEEQFRVRTRPHVIAVRTTQCTGYFVSAIVLLTGCGEKSPPPTPLNGHALAATACAQCHSVPAPDLMSREEWPYLLSWMGHYVGQPGKVEINPAIVARNFIPPQPLVTREQFDAIQKHYLENAPAHSQLPPPAPKPPASPRFQPVPFPLGVPVITLVAFDPPNQALVVGLSSPPGLLILQRGVTTPIEVSSEPVSFERLGDVSRIGFIGHLSRDARQGQVVDFGMKDGTRSAIVDAHPRIAAHRTADLDADGQNDLLVCGFGDYPSGRVGIWWNNSGQFAEELLLDEPGTSWGDIADFDGDGDLDLILMIASNRPRLVAFINEGHRQFSEQTIVIRPVGWGYNRGLVVDWNADGKPDLVETTGNNLELRGRPIKASHGVRVLQNEGQWKFREVLFERLDGAIDVAAADFDGNGRVDLAAVSLYPDWRLPTPTTFLLLLQQTDGSVERAGVGDQHWNRWMRIAAGDADGDGDADILLGASPVPLAIPAEHAARYEQLLQGKASLLLLRNLAKP